MRCLVTGCAGFIGSHLVDRLIKQHHTVIGFDNLSTGSLAFLKNAWASSQFIFIQEDLANLTALKTAMQDIDIVFHFAANADVRHGLNHPHKDLTQNTLHTFHVLEAMREMGVKKIVFASTGSVYGEASIIPTPETAPFPVQTSLYAASKLAAEGFIEAYCEGFGMQAYIFRFVSMVGERYSHGHIVDFYAHLKKDPTTLPILGNGQQKKSYLYVQDGIDAILLALEKAPAKINIFNLGTDEYCRVDDSVQWICEALNVNPIRTYSGGERGWVGDNPFIFLDCTRIRSLGWKPTLTIREGVIKTLEYLDSLPIPSPHPSPILAHPSTSKCEQMGEGDF